MGHQTALSNLSATFFSRGGGVAPHLHPIPAESFKSMEAHIKHTQRLEPPITTYQNTHVHLDPDAAPFKPQSGFVSEPSLPDHSLLEYEDDLWEHLLESHTEDSASKPGPCACHNLPTGSCPDVIQDFINLICRVKSFPGQSANMDGARIPLPVPSFPLDPWRDMLCHYFDAHNLTQAFEYGWDMSLQSNPSPLDVPRNLPSASAAAADVDKYVATELSFGALVGPINLTCCPFPVFCSPLGTVEKTGSDTRRTIVDCSQRGRGINAFIPANLHRGTDWKLSLPNIETIVTSIRKVRHKYPGQRILMFKVDFSRYFRWFALDPGQVPFLAIRWRGHTYLDQNFSFGNRGACLAAQRASWAVCYAF